MRTLIVDADYIAYRYAFANQLEIDWGEGVVSHSADLKAAKREIVSLLGGWAYEFEANIVLAFSDPESNWRTAVLPSYKQHRKADRRPDLWEPLRDFLAENWKNYLRPTLEGDDICGILATSKTVIPGDKIVVGIDKDLKTIPCKLFNPVKGTRKVVSVESADHLHMIQTLTGDPSDGYKGCPGIGPKKAEKILGPQLGPNYRDGRVRWSAIVGAYSECGLTEEDALVQARVARVCRHTDYNFRKKEVKLWKPPVS